MAKRWPGNPPGILQPVADPLAPSKEISMDFIEVLPESSSNMVIWMVTDLFSKQAYFIACQKIPSAGTLAKLFVQHVYRLQWVAEQIISDQGVKFTSKSGKNF